MKNLIMADMKILGSRVWRIPLGFAAACFVFSLLTGFSDKDYTSLVYFINLFLLPVLMLYELLREEQKNKSEMMILTMPVNKSKFVYSRFVVTTIFIISGVLSLAASLALKSIFSDDIFIQLSQDPKKWLSYFCGIYFIIFLIISLYYYTLKLYVSIFSATVGLFLLLVLNLWLQDSFLLRSDVCWSDDFDLYLYPQRLIYLFGSLIIVQFILQRLFKNISKRIIYNVWFFIFSVILFNYILRVLNIVFFEYSVISNVQKNILLNDGTYTPEMILKWNKNIDDFFVYFPMLTIITIILLTAWSAVFIKNKDTIIKSFILISQVPFVSMVFIYLTYLFFESFLKIDVQYVNDTFYLSIIMQILFIPLCFYGFAKLTTKILNSKQTY